MAADYWSRYLSSVFPPSPYRCTRVELNSAPAQALCLGIALGIARFPVLVFPFSNLAPVQLFGLHFALFFRGEHRGTSVYGCEGLLSSLRAVLHIRREKSRKSHRGNLTITFWV